MAPHAVLLFLASFGLAAVLSLGLPTGASVQAEDAIRAADDDGATESAEREDGGAGGEVGAAQSDGAALGERES